MRIRLTPAFIIVYVIVIAEGCNEKHFEDAPRVDPRGGGSPTSSRPPLANAGADQTITFLTAYNKATLNGIKSYDSSGMNVQFFWRQISGPVNAFLQLPSHPECNVYSINTPGVYSFELKVWNNNGTDFDTTNITVSIPSYCQSSRPEMPATLTFLSNMPEHTQNPEIVVAGNKLIFPSFFNNQTGVFSTNVALLYAVRNVIV